MTRNGRKIPRSWFRFDKAANTYETLFAALFQTTTKITGLKEFTAKYGGEAVDETYILKMLYTRGGIAFDKSTGLWLPFWGTGRLDWYGRYNNYRLYGANGNSFNAKKDNVFIFLANPNGSPILANAIRDKSHLIQDLDLAIQQNLDTIKECTLITYDDRIAVEAIEQADKARRDGQSVTFLPRKFGQIGDIQSIQTGGTYYVDKLQAARRIEIEDCLHLVGVKTPQEKAERLITSEVNTQNAEAGAYIGIMHNVFNAACERYGIADELKMTTNDITYTVKEIEEDYSNEQEKDT